MQNIFVKIAIRTTTTTKMNINLNIISIDSYLNEKFCWANQIFVDSTKLFQGVAKFKSSKLLVKQLQSQRTKIVEIQELKI